MKKILAACLIASTAFAGERLLGIISHISTTKSNLSQNPDGAAFFWDGGYTQPFFIPEGAKLTLLCNDPMYVCTDKSACTATDGLPVGSGILLTTSVGGTAATTIDQAGLADAGLGAGGGRPIRSAQVAILSQVTDGGYHRCQVWERTGKE